MIVLFSENKIGIIEALAESSFCFSHHQLLIYILLYIDPFINYIYEIVDIFDFPKILDIQ